jgi:hypothetical protein
VKQVGRELGVRYVVEGSVRRGGNRLRIASQLADATTGTQIWADRFDGTPDDVFDLQDRVTTTLISAVEPGIRASEIERARRKPTVNLAAHDLVLRALPLIYTNRLNSGLVVVIPPTREGVIRCSFVRARGLRWLHLLIWFGGTFRLLIFGALRAS